jgi:hypothetical protein
MKEITNGSNNKFGRIALLWFFAIFISFCVICDWIGCETHVVSGQQECMEK